jgi:short-subunit dehydrogenase
MWSVKETVLTVVVMYCMRSQIQNMKEGGSIVNASSIAGIMGFPKNAAYTASKHGTVKVIAIQ